MIRTHEFNTAWWGAPAGIVDDAGFFSLPLAEQQRQLSPYAWVEYRAVAGTTPAFPSILRAGFFHADTQVRYRIGLDKVSSTSSVEQLQVRNADASSISVCSDDVAGFRNERYLHLPGITADRVNDRYARWSNLLISESPGLCLEVADRGDVQGWFLSRMTESGLNLTLAMLHRNARISGLHLYQKAMLAYGSSGRRVGWASFSVDNVAVLNILSELGARFTTTEYFWFWVNPAG